MQIHLTGFDNFLLLYLGEFVSKSCWLLLGIFYGTAQSLNFCMFCFHPASIVAN